MTLDEWVDAVATELRLNITDTAAVRDPVLDLARDAAHGVARPAAPLTTFLLGLAVGQGMAVQDAAARIRALIPRAE